MKALKDLTPSDDAELLHQLFPDEMLGLLNFIKDMCITIQEDLELNRRTWSNPHYDFDFFLELSRQVQTSLNRDWALLLCDATIFATQLLEGYRQLFISIASGSS